MKTQGISSRDAHPPHPRLWYGRLKSPDQRDRLHPMAAHIHQQPPERTEMVWSPPPILDQGATPRCTAFAWTSWRLTGPHRIIGPPTQALYASEQAIDGFEHVLPLPDDSNASGGSSVRAGAKYLQILGLIGEYVWASTAQEAGNWVLNHGPVVIGIDWYEGFDNPDVQGFVHPTGQIIGGHALNVIGYDAKSGNFLLPQSWGLDWPSQPSKPSDRWKGFFRMSSQTLDQLLSQGGEAVAAIKKGTQIL